MGLPSDLTNVSSDSIPILIVALAAQGVCYIKSLLYVLLHSIGLSRFRPTADGADELVMGSSFVAVGEHANMSRVHTLREEREGQQVGGGGGEEEEEKNGCWVDDDDDDGLDVGSSAVECVVCLSGMRDGEQVRKLACCHVFHAACLEGWFDHQKTSCPLCRAPLASVDSHEPVRLAG